MPYMIIEYSKIRQQEIQQEFEAIHRIRMSRPEGVNRPHAKTLRDLKNVLFSWCYRLILRARRA